MSKRENIEPGHRDQRWDPYLDRCSDEFQPLMLARFVELTKASDEHIPKEQLIGLACRIYDSRRARARFFNESLMGEPVWDMLLALYCLPARNESLSVTGLCQASSVPTTTAMRWSQLMVQKGLVERTPDLHDGRRVHLSLSKKGEELMSDYLTHIYRKVTVG